MLTDGTTTITGTINNVTNGTLQNITFNSYGELVGNVTLKLYAWGWTEGYRMGKAVKIYGTIEDGVTPPATISWTTQPANGQVGAADFEYAVSCSDGSEVTVTSENTDVASIVDGKLHYVAEGSTRLVATATDKCGNVITSYSNQFTVGAMVKYAVTHTLSNVTATAGATGAEAAQEGTAYSATFEANEGYVLPDAINVTIGGTTQTAGTGYTWNPETGSLNIPANKVTGNIVITIAGAVKAPELICEELFYAKANSKSTFATTVGTIVTSNFDEGKGDELSGVDGFEFSVKPANSDNSLTISPKDDFDFQAGDKITVWVYNNSEKTMGFKLKSSGSITAEVPAKTLYAVEATLVAGDITTTDGNTTIVIGRNSSDARWVAVQVERCVEKSCTAPVNQLTISTPASVQASQPAAISVTGGNNGPIAFTVTPATGAVTGNEGAYSFSATEVGEYVIKATQADFNGVCGGNATCVISVTAIGSLTAPTITATDLNGNTEDAFTFCETDNDDALKVEATSTEEGVTYAYQWYVKETDSNVFTAITGATEDIYPPTMDGTYYCEVTAKKPGYASASANSKEWTITITQSTAIISQPTSVALEGGQATLEVEAEGENLQYQWYSCEDDNRTNPETITGATNSTYTATAEGYYYVVVHSDCGVDRTSDVVQVLPEVEYCFSMTKNAEKGTIAAGTNVDVTSYFDVTEGAKITFTMGGGREADANGVKFDNNKDQMTITLPEGSTFAAGSIIEFVVYAKDDNRGLTIDGDAVTGTRTNNLISLSYTLPADFTTSQSLSITRAGGAVYLRSLTVSNCGASCSDKTPTLTASTNNISASTEVTLTASNYTGGATLSFYKEGVAEPLQTGAGSTCTVTVDVTSTFYVVAVNDCERRSSSVTVTFTCATPQPKIIQVGGVLGCNETVTLKAVTQEGKDITGDDGTLQWYKNGVAIDGANTTTLELDLDDAGEYTVSLTKGCMAMSTNTAVVSNEVPEPELEVLAPRQYYQLNHDYTEEQQLRYLMKLTLPEGTDVAGATDGAYQITATLEENTLDATQFVENKIEEGVYWIMLNLNSLTANADTYGLAAGNIISIKVTPLNLCGEYPAELAHTVEVKVTDKPTLAFIVSGADGNGTKEKKSHKVNGDFLTGYNKADLCLQTGTTSFDNTQELPLYTYLKEYFEVVPVNGYAPYNYYNYDPFDIALLTDFPKTKAGVGNDTLISAANLNALADLVDRKPLLSLKTHMVNTALGAWSEKGFIENPLTTKNQVNMTLLCHAHEMFKEDITIAPDDEGNVQVDILTQVGFDANKGMQGFRALASTNFINIATTVNSADNTNLVACCERQANVQARMLLLSINADATSFISDNGKIVIRNALHYLLQTDPTHVSDCSIVFDNGGGVGRTVTLKGTTYTSGDNEWGNPANWSTSTLPNQANNVLIEANCQVTNKHAQTGVGVYGVANVRINENYTLTIAPTGGIVSTGLFAVYKPGEKYNAVQITDPKYVTVQADETNTGLLMHSHQETLHATVQMYSPANHDKEGGYNTAGFHKVKNYTDVAVPVEVDAAFFQNNGHEAQYWKWNEKGTVGFERQTTGTVPHFQGGCISHCDPQLFSFAGQVALAKDHPYEMTYTEGGWYGINVVGNSWTAPIQILELTAADFGSNLEKTIYIYNTGHDATAGTGVASQADFSTPGQWMAIPIETAKTGDWNGPKVIPAMQAFQVLTLYPLVTPADGETQEQSQTLTIGYNKHIRCRGAVNGLTQKLYAPQRPKKAPRTGLPSTAEVLMPDPNKVDTFVTPTMLRVMFVADSVKTDVYLFEDDQRFKNGFDNGWDGTYQNDETVSGAYVLTEAGNMAISAQPYLEGTTVALKSKKTTTFQCTFKYTGTETLYLNDTKLEQSTKIEEGASYVFMASPEDAPNRFVISAEPYQGSITGMAGVVMVDNALVVNNPLQEPLRVFIYDAVGRTHHVYDTKAAMEEINLPNVPGVYLIRVKGENTDLVHKVVR
ncbi:MAG: T9SS type A sorting domain-containing protein [Paludibacteraceae bacterium]|nr:T9SS type A sorting domain-containing protein [Paludibacteraceae bacterium]